MKRLLAAAAIVATASGLAGVASANCANVEPVIVPQVRIDPLDAAGPGEVMQPFTLTFRRAGADSAPIKIRYQVVDEDSNVQTRVGVTQGPVVVWQSRDSVREIGAFRSEAYPLLRAGGVVIGENDQAVQTTIYMRLINLREDLPAGVYREQFSIRYWCGGEDNALPYEANGIVAVSVAVPNVLSASIAGASARGEVDFLDFSVPVRDLLISVRSTGPYRVTARSVNGGVLLRETASNPDEADRIGYTATLDGKLLATEGVSSKPMTRAGLLGRQMSLQVKVGDVSDKRAGAYADTLLLTLAPAN